MTDYSYVYIIQGRTMLIRLATIDDIINLSSLFNEYRCTFGKTSDEIACRGFIEQRLAENDSIIFVTFKGEEMVGFIQLYQSFSTINLSSVWYLDDAFVLEPYRGQGIALSMLERAKLLAKSAQVEFVDEKWKSLKLA